MLASRDRPSGDLAEWARSWDRIVLADSPGAATIYAFIDAGNLTSRELARQVNELASGIAASGMAQGPPLRVITVAVYPHGLSERPRAITGIAPATYYAGIRPATWAVDLSSGQVYPVRRWMGGNADIIRRAASTGDGEILDESGVEVLQHLHSQRMAAFYRLMEGRQPVLTYMLIAINIAIFLLLYQNGGPGNATTLRDFGALSPQLVQQGQWWRVFSSMFLHASIPHILFNMTSLFAVGVLAERLYGSARFLAIYLGSGLLGSLVSLGYGFASGNIDVLGVGASGAIFGVAGALLTVRFQRSEIIPQQLRDRVSLSLLPLVGLSLALSFITPYVDNGAHIGGLLGGMALSFVFPLPRHLKATKT